ncbi:MAG: DNA-binding protein [Ignavibacteria bacterium GWB2_35_12]|nr:MAG: DNA-binding protein [Ignavibacteria bacterium GWA2_35_8]OGU41803.1 MAG: DNA-binding protein [Ignavibacteria bacterium GWB2_35_12]OGU92595.1 MAG: DNA-binding protein [Ignavibacteria bacterium RIFOXYA2_FULL_35_10]OGV24337.1 MAG: DNA-binding protein [Ignavibacteria bacterium RIFOXYC2_FULL_35_21]
MDEKVKYWLSLSEYDLDTAEAMLQTNRFLYVGFMCHQSVEKILKAYFTKLKSTTAPYTHNLTFLSKETGIYEQFNDVQKEIIQMIEPLNIESRYPSYKEKIFESLNYDRCVLVINSTKDLVNWIKKKL